MADINTAQTAAQQALLAAVAGNAQALTLVEGRTLDARVQQSIGNGLLRLLTVQGVLDIATRSDLPVGSRLRLQVLNTAGELALSLVPQDATSRRTADPIAARLSNSPASPSVVIVPRPRDGSAPVSPPVTPQLAAGALLSNQGSGNNPTPLTPSSLPNTAQSVVIVDLSRRGGAVQPANTLPAASQSATPNRDTTSPIAATVVESLLRQGPLAPLFANLAAILARPRDLPEPLRNAANRVASATLPLDEAVSPPQLLDAIANSGVFLENTLAGGNKTTNLNADLKAALLGLRDALVQAALSAESVPAPIAVDSEVDTAIVSKSENETPKSSLTSEKPNPPRRGDLPEAQRPAAPDLPENASTKEIATRLLDQTESALARIRLSQLANRPPENVPTDQRFLTPIQTSYYVEIPVQLRQQFTTLQVAVEREAKPGSVEGASATYRLWFSFDSEPAGPVSAVIAWQPGAENGGVSATLWAEREETGRALRDGLAGLRQDLRAADLPIVEVTARLGKAQRPARGGAHAVDRTT